MCGIAGFTGTTNSSVLKKMTDSIVHRGPNDAAYIVTPEFSVGYRRLAIIDLSQNIYPIENETKTIELVLNGEIYNYQELRSELEATGHVFVTHSDSETIVHGYEEWGYDVVQHLRGMFVFVLLDKTKNELFIARDRLGIKPFYYTLHDGRIVFGSEMKSLFQAFPDISREPDDRSVYRFLQYRIHDTDEHTFFKAVKRLLPGHFMIINADSSFDIKKYWEPEYNQEFTSKKSDADYAAEFKEIFTEATRLHLIADVPVGVTLSGGLDSSGITALSAKLCNEATTLTQESITPPNLPSRGGNDAITIRSAIIAFSAVHPGEKIDESEYIDSVVEHTGIKSVKIQPQVDTFWEEIDQWVDTQEEPVISGAPYAYYTVMREAAKRVTVLLSGQGGDELLAGYIPYFMSYVTSAIDERKFWQIARETWMGKDLYFPFLWKRWKEKRAPEEPLSPATMLTDAFKKEFADLGTTFTPSRNLNERLFFDVTRDTTPSLLRYEDKNSMAHSLESRVPFFDHKVVEYIFNLPIDQKIKFGWNRYIYRNAMKGVIPDKNRLRRSKVGFTNPEWEWIERKAATFKEIFSSESFKSRSYWNAKTVLSEFEQTLAGKKKGDHLLFWRLFITEMWMRRYVD